MTIGTKAERRFRRGPLTSPIDIVSMAHLMDDRHERVGGSGAFRATMQPA